MQDKELWMKRSKELLTLAAKVNENLVQGSVAPEKILSAMFMKGMQTFEAIRLLYMKNLPEQAQVLVRVLFELRLDFYEFIHRISPPLGQIFGYSSQPKPGWV